MGFLYIPVNQVSLHNLENMEAEGSLMMMWAKNWIQAAGGDTWLFRFVLVMLLLNTNVLDRELLGLIFMRV